MRYSYNTIGWYTTKGNRQYDNSGEPLILHHYETGKVPSFQLIIDSEITTASAILYDYCDNEITTITPTIETDETDGGQAYSKIIFKGETLSSQEEGYCYIILTCDAINYYSDVWAWDDNMDEFLKITATSSNFAIGGFENNMDGFTYEVYLEANESNLEYDIDEEGVDKTYGTVALYNARRKESEFEITGYKTTLDFLAGLRILQTNGAVALTWKGDEFEIYDIENPDTETNYTYCDILIITIKFKRKDYLQTVN